MKPVAILQQVANRKNHHDQISQRLIRVYLYKYYKKTTSHRTRSFLGSLSKSSSRTNPKEILQQFVQEVVSDRILKVLRSRE